MQGFTVHDSVGKALRTAHHGRVTTNDACLICAYKDTKCSVPVVEVLSLGIPRVLYTMFFTVLIEKAGLAGTTRIYKMKIFFLNENFEGNHPHI
jgi:hypothetical protein